MNRKPYLILAVLILFVFLFVFFVYTFLHELGHALMGLLFGQTLTEFNVSFWDFSAHVGLSGGAPTPAQLALRSAAGTLLPILVWTFFIIGVPRKANFTLEILKLLSSMVVVNTLLTWIALPVLFLFGKAPSDDVTNFLNYSQMPPLLLTLIAAILYTGGWVLFLSKIDGLQNELNLFRITDPQKLLVGARTPVTMLTGVLAFCILFVFLLKTSADTSLRFAAPAGFEPFAEIDLSTQEYSSEILAQFTLHEPELVGVFLVVRDINTTYFDLSVTGPDGFHSTVLHGEGYYTLQDGGLWERTLPPGTYQVVLTSHQSPGDALVYMKTTLPDE